MHCILHRWPMHKSHLRSRRLQLTVLTLCSISAFRVHEAASGLDCKWFFNAVTSAPWQTEMVSGLWCVSVMRAQLAHAVNQVEADMSA
jgi:hypothetical protein